MLFRSDGIVFDGKDLGDDTQLVAAKIDRADLLLVSPANRPGGNPAVGVAATRLLAGEHEGLLRTRLRDVRKVGVRDVTR